VAYSNSLSVLISGVDVKIFELTTIGSDKSVFASQIVEIATGA
jgi:hypothetical protein